MTWTVSPAEDLTGYTVEFINGSGCYLSKANKIYFTTDFIKPFEKIASINAPRWKQMASSFRIVQRLLRFMVTNVLPLSNGELFVTFDKSCGVIRNGKYKSLKGLVRPCRVLRSACAVDNYGYIYFGEYIVARETGEVRIYKYMPGYDRVEVVHAFPPNAVKHVHGLYFDKYSDAIYCLSGDHDSECRIMRSFDGFKTLETVGEGDESWRAVSVLFDKENFYYGTDAEHSENHIYKVNRETLQRTKLLEVSGTVFYSIRVGKDMFFSTTAENAPSQQENVAALWHIDEAGRGSQVTSFKKDRWHPTYFQFGTIHFPAGSASDSELYFHLVGVEEDNRVFRLKKAV